jgi:hypothetical protein
MGCHAGFNAPDGQSAAPEGDLEPALDFPQAAAQQKAIWIASTGFGIGDDEGIAGTEEIMGRFANELVNSGLTAGEAHAKTLREYILAQNPLTVYDVKSAVQTTFYGLTMYAVEPQSVGSLATLSGADIAENVGYSFALTTVDTTSAVTSVSTNHTLEPNDVDDGVFYTADGTATSVPRGDAQATMGRAVQPRIVEDLGARHPHPGEPLPIHGLMVTGGSYIELPDFDPLISRRKFEWERGVTEPQECLEGFSPSQPIAVNGLRSTGPLEQRLVVIPGQFRCTSGDADTVTGTERLWTSMTVDIRRCATTDEHGPVINRVDIRAIAGGSEITVDASDESGLSRIVALRIAGGVITPFQLELDGEESGEFVLNVPAAGIPQEELYLQVEDTQCNTSVHTAKAGYLNAITVNAGPDREFETGPTTFTATITGFATLNDDITFRWDFGDGTTMSGILSPNGLGTVPVTIDAMGNGTFTVNHTYDAFPVPTQAVLNVAEGLGGAGVDDLLITSECEEEHHHWYWWWFLHWWVHDDGDCDGFPGHHHSHSRGSEAFIGTDETASCPADNGHAAWPPDFDNSGDVRLSDVVTFGPYFNKHSWHPEYWSRYDLTGNGAVDLSDVVAIAPFFNNECMQ